MRLTLGLPVCVCGGVCDGDGGEGNGDVRFAVMMGICRGNRRGGGFSGMGCRY